MNPNDPRHGRYRGAQAHIRDGEQMCEPCRLAFRRYQNGFMRDRSLGRTRRVPTASVRAHVVALVAAGMPVPAIAARSGIGRSTVQDLITRTRPSMNRDLAECLLAVKPDPVPHANIDPLGTRRRVQALACLGWSYTDIAAESRHLGHQLTIGGIRQFMIVDGPVKVRTHQTVSAIYDRLSMKFAPPSRGASNVRNRAAARGYLPPLAWDDIDTDPTPTAARTENRRDSLDEAVVLRVMAGEHLPMTAAERREVVQRLRDRGMSYTEIERHTGITKVDRHVKREVAA